MSVIEALALTTNFIMNKIGIIQGRLTPSKNRGIQFFPFDNWENEFQTVSELGLDEIEFIFDFERYQENPLWSESGLERVNELIKQHNVKVNYICADFFMVRPFFKVSEKERKENIEIFKKLIKAAAKIGAKGIEIPLVDNSSIKTKEEENLFAQSIQECLATAKDYNIILGLETDLPPKKFLKLLERFNNSLLRANYDSGNSASLGYDSYEEVTILGNYISNIHIKDRVFQGTTVPLGTGGADFDKLFQGLKKINYNNSFILQAARGLEGEEVKTTKEQLKFLKGYIKKYLE